MAEREVNMRRITKRRLSSLLCAVLMLITSIDVAAFAAGSDASKRKIDVWDMGAVQEADTSKYNNNITASDWDSCANVSQAGKFVAGETTFGDLTINHIANDRLFSTSSKNYGTNALATTAYDDGYTAGGMYYCNGTMNTILNELDCTAFTMTASGLRFSPAPFWRCCFMWTSSPTSSTPTIGRRRWCPYI